MVVDVNANLRAAAGDRPVSNAGGAAGTTRGGAGPGVPLDKVCFRRRYNLLRREMIDMSVQPIFL